MAVWLPVQCPHCHSTEVVKNGKSAEGKQRYRCQNADCPHRTFVLNQVYPGRTRQVKQQIVEMTLTCLWHSRYCPRATREQGYGHSGIKKKVPQLQSVNQSLLSRLSPEQVEVDIVQVEEPTETGIEESEQG